MPRRIAVASARGTLVDTHFGHANRFDVYDILDSGYAFAETRSARSACHGGGHDASSFDATLELLGDCEAVFVSVIGYGAAAYLNEKGMRVFEAPYAAVEDVVAKVASEGLLEPGDRGQRKT
jgi:nitrogen fixation protein NifX